MNRPYYKETHDNPVHSDWTREEIADLFALPFNELVFQAASLHRHYFNPNEVQASTLLSIKTGSCPEDCKYCPQSSHYKTNLEKSPLMQPEEVLKQAQLAKEAGATRFCMGAAWRNLHDRDTPVVAEIIRNVKAEGLETCMTLGMLTECQAKQLKEAGLDYYNHNIDTSPEYYGEIITTRTFADRLETLSHVRNAGMKVCCGGIVGLGETEDDRIAMLHSLATLPVHPESVPINMLVRVQGTPLDTRPAIDILEFIRTLAVARIVMPASYIRLSAGREQMSEEAQALCFFAGANSIFYGERLLTTANPQEAKDIALLGKLGMTIQRLHSTHTEAEAA